MMAPSDDNAANEQLLTAKLAAPPPPAWVIQRPALAAQLDAVFDHKVVTLTAPPGFGKTTAMAQWASQSGAAPTAWLSLDVQDNSPLMLLRYLVAAFARLSSSFGARAARLLSADPLSPTHVALSLLLADVSASPGKMVLVLDDVDRLHDPSTLELLNLLIERSPAKLGFIVAGTHCRGIRPQVLLSQGRLHRIESRDLRLGKSEASALAHAAGVSDSRLLRQLVRESDGWIAGIRLMLSAYASPSSVLVDPVKRQRQDIFEFFGHSVLPRLPDTQVEFLHAVSALGRFNAALANAALERNDAALLIERLDALGVFIQRLDADGDWYRLDHLAQAFFAYRLQSEAPERYRRIHLNAAQWLLSHGLWHDAVSHAMAAPAPEQAADWLAQRAMDLIESSDLRAVKECLALLPAHVVEDNPRLLLAQAWAHTLSLETQAADRSLLRVKRLCDPAGVDARADLATMQLELQAIRAMHQTLKDDSEGGCTLAQEVLRHQPPPGSCTWRMARTAEVVGLIYRGDFSIIEQLEAAVVASRDKARGMPTYARVYMKSVLGLGYLVRGELSRAEHILSRAYRLAVESIGRESAAAALPAGYLSQIYYDWDRFDPLDRLLAEHESEVIRTTAIGAAARFAAIKIRRLFQRGDHSEAMALIDESAQLALGNGWSRMYCYVQAEAVRIHLARGSVRDAALAHARMSAEWSPGTLQPTGTALENWTLWTQSKADIALAKGLPEESIDCLTPLIEHLTHLGMHQLSITPRLSLAMAQRAIGGDAAAIETIETALERGAASFATRPFVDAGSGIRDLLDAFVRERLSQCPQLSWFLQNLYSAIELAQHAAHAPAPADTEAPSDPLTPRETEILSALCVGMSNKQLARHLELSQETVKWHLKNIYAKLRIRTRSQAIITWRELTLSRRAETKPK